MYIAVLNRVVCIVIYTIFASDVYGIYNGELKKSHCISHTDGMRILYSAYERPTFTSFFILFL